MVYNAIYAILGSSGDITLVPPMCPVFNPETRSDKGLTLETSAFRISVWWPIYIINSVDKTKFLYTTSPPTQHHSFFRNYPFIIIWVEFVGSLLHLVVFSWVLRFSTFLKNQHLI